MLACYPAKPDVSVINETVTALKNDLVVVMPTETQYSLSVRSDHDSALSKICSIKQRSVIAKMALFVKDLDMAQQFCEISEAAKKLTAAFLPGPLTLVLPEKQGQNAVDPGFLSEDGFGIRISSSPVISAVMEKVPFAVTATSANISGKMTPDSVSDINLVLGDSVDLYLDAGPCHGVIPSTVVKVADTVAILRHGVISESEIMRCLQEEK